jgi:hypothetical protein
MKKAAGRTAPAATQFKQLRQCVLVDDVVLVVVVLVVPLMPVEPVMPVIPVAPVSVLMVADVSVDIVLLVPVMPVSVDEVEVVIDVSDSVVVSCFLHETENSARAAMVRRTRIDFFIMSPLDELFSVK